MQTIITLALLAFAGLILIGIINLVDGITRQIWRKVGPFLVALVVAFGALIAGSVIFGPWLAADDAALAGLALSIAAFIAAYMIARRWFADNWSGKIDRATEARLREERQRDLPLPKPSVPFCRLPMKKQRPWRRADHREQARFLHVTAYLRTVLPEHSESIAFSEKAIVEMWGRGADPMDAAFRDVGSNITVWLSHCEASLEETQRLSRIQHLAHCVRLVHSLEAHAIKVRQVVLQHGDAAIDTLKARTDLIAKL